jgi:selenocysteine lyase/cysteine desulfurase
MEIAVDGAHSVGSVPNLDVTEMNCDYFFSNLHKWAFAPSTSTILWSKHLPETKHPIVSWSWGQGMSEESLFPGTRDFSSYLAVPAASEYFNKSLPNMQGPYISRALINRGPIYTYI